MSTLECQLLDQVDQMLLVVEPDSLRIVMANRVATSVLGYSMEELLEKTILDVECALQDVFYWEEVRFGQRSNIDSQEGLYTCADGSMYSAIKSVRSVMLDGKSFLLVQAREVPRGLSIEEDLAYTTSQLRATLESTGNGILVIDWQSRISSMNRLFSTMWQLPEELLLTQDEHAILDHVCAQVINPDAFRQRLREIVESQETRETEDILHLRDGQVFQCKSLPQYLDERIIGRVFGFNDITERISIEKALISAREKAESANQAKAAFLAMMSHEIRTPINGVMGVATLLSDTPLDAEQKRYLEIIRSSSEALLTIVNDVLDVSKIEAHKLVLEAIDFCMPDLLEEIADLYGLRADEKNLEYAWSLDPSVPERLCGDPGRIRQVLTNLIGNALKFTHSGSISLRVTRLPDRQGRIVLHAEVEDTGIGIASENIDKVFAPFEQADSSTTRKYGGTGLGLTITRQLVELMEGEIGVVSQEHVGTTFMVDMLLKPAVSETEPIRPLAAFPEIRALVVDDNPVARHGLAFQLKALGLVADEASNAQEAMTRMASMNKGSSSYQCVFIDQNMPGCDGKWLARRLVEEGADSAVRLILCISAGRHIREEDIRADGFAAYVHKPVTRRALARCLEQVFAESRASEDNQTDAAEKKRVEKAIQPYSVLVVEDNAINMLVIKGLLDKLGYARIDKARDGLEGVELASRQSYDLILMDCQMPKLDGYAATRRLRELGIETPIIAMTAHALEGDREKCLDAGMNDYLTKPIDIGRLSECLGRWLPAAAEPAKDQARAPDAGGGLLKV